MYRKLSGIFFVLLLLISITYNAFQVGEVAVLQHANDQLIRAAITFATDAEVLKNYIYSMKRKGM
jgi:hypothetical protein